MLHVCSAIDCWITQCLPKEDIERVVRCNWTLIGGELCCPIRSGSTWILLIVDQVNQMLHQKKKFTGIQDLIEFEALSYAEARHLWCVSESNGENAVIYDPRDASCYVVSDAIDEACEFEINQTR